MIIVPDHGNRKGVSKPRSIVRLDGNDVWFNNWTVNLNSTSQADDFQIELPFRIIRNQPQSYLMNTPEDPSYLLVKSDILVEVYVGYPNNPDSYQIDDLTRILYGYVDSIEINCSSTGEIVTLTGRNMVAPFLDNKVTSKYQNKTASAIVRELAGQQGLKADVSTTYTLSGKYANNDSAEMSSDQSQWDLMTYLAEQEGFSLRVADDTVLFGPFDKVVGSQTDVPPLAYTWGQNVEDFQITRAPHAVKNVQVEVHSYNADASAHVQANSSRSFKGASDTYHERYFFAGLTQAQAQVKANSILAELSRLELTGQMNVAGNENLTVDRKIGLYGVGAGLSDIYFVRKAQHKFDFSGGYRTQVTFSNLLTGEDL